MKRKCEIVCEASIKQVSLRHHWGIHRISRRSSTIIYLITFWALHSGISLFAQSGSLDTKFTPYIWRNSWVESIAVQADERILIGGVFTRVNGIPREGIARLNLDGSLDTSFTPPSMTGWQNAGLGVQSIDEAKALVTQGQLLIQGNNFLGAVDKFLEALTKIKPLLQRIQKASITPSVGLNIQSQLSGAANRVEIVLRGVPGDAVEIEFSPNLMDWRSFKSITLDANGRGILRIPESTGSVQGFYRIQSRAVELK